MIREVRLEDVKAITAIYNEYVINSTATFETQPVKEEEMCARVRAISTNFPYFVYEADNEIAGYCYAHPWKEKAAYKYTLENTINIYPQNTRNHNPPHSQTHRQRHRTSTPAKIDRRMPSQRLPCTHRLHNGRK